MPDRTSSTLTLDAAVDLTRTGDLWLFRGRSAADHAIRAVTNSPVNHVGMAVVLDDLPPLMWHAELGRGLLDVWTGTHHRGVQLHDLRAAVEQWTTRYAQRAWLRQLDAVVTPAMESALLRTIAKRAVPGHHGARGPLGARATAAACRVGGDDVLRGGGRGDVRRDGSARRCPADELLRSRQLLVRRRARALRRRPARRRDRRPDATRLIESADSLGAQ
jgi:hypothetical protein